MTLVLEIGWNEAATHVAVVDTAAHSRVGEGQAAHPDADGALADPAAWWAATVQATGHAIDALSALGLHAGDLRTVVVSAGDPPGGLVALGPDGTPVHPAVLGSHVGSAADADWLLGQLDGGRDAWVSATDLVPTAGSTVALLSWLHRTAPEAWDAATRFTLPAGWLLERLGGEAAVGTHDAIGTAVLDHHSGERWRTELLALVDRDRNWISSLPVVAPSARAVGHLSDAAASELGVPSGLPLHVGAAGLEPVTA
jgi:sugar (pentulose or hexulose) kinase